MATVIQSLESASITENIRECLEEEKIASTVHYFGYSMAIHMFLNICEILCSEVTLLGFHEFDVLTFYAPSPRSDMTLLSFCPKRVNTVFIISIYISGQC